MFNVFKGALLALVREKSVFIWSLAFPLILSTMFVFMFANLDEAGQFEPIPTAVVADENYDAAPGFSEMIDTLAEPGADQMLDVARAHYADGAADGVPVDFEVVDAQDIPYADASYDAVTMAYGIRNMPDRPRALAEMFRVLKPGGALVCLEFSTPPNAVWRALYNFYLKHLIPFWGGLITGDREGFVYLARSIRAFPDQQGLAAMMEKAGFEDVTWKNYTGGIAAVHVARKPAR